MFGVGPWELAIVGIVAVLLFGGRLPKLARAAGQSLMEFRRGFKEVEHECQLIEQEIENQ